MVKDDVASAIGFDPSRTDIQIWPMGHGMVYSAIGEKDMAGVILMAAVPNSLVRENWQTAEPPTWNEIIEASQDQGQLAIIHFLDRASIDRFIATLRQARRRLPRAAEFKDSSHGQ